MKKNDLEMAWNEPRDQQDPENKPRNPNSGGGAPDLDEIIDKLKKKFLGGSSNKSGGTGGSLGGGLNERMMGKALLFVIPIALILWLATGIYVVDAGKKGVVLFLGKKQSITDPGIRWRFPSPIGAHKLIDIERRFSQKIGGTSNNSSKEAMMLTKDEAIVDVRIEAQYQIDALNPERYWFASIDPDVTLRDVIESATRERVGQTALDEVLTSGREQLMVDVKELAQSVLDKYQIGLIITNVNLEDAQPPEPVQAAFSDAIRSREDEQSRRNQADAYERQVVLEAEGEAAREINKAEAYRDSLIAEAAGESERFTQLLVAYSKAPEITKKRLYLEAMEEVLKGTNKVIMGQQGNNLMMLPLEQMFKGSINNKAEDNRSTPSVMTPPTVTTAPTQMGAEKRQQTSDIRLRTRDRY